MTEKDGLSDWSDEEWDAYEGYVFEFEYETVYVPEDQAAAVEAERQYIYDNITTMFW